MKWKTLLKKVVIYFLLFVVIVAFFVPIYWMVATSFKLPKDALSVPPKFLFKPTLANYEVVLLARRNPAVTAGQITTAHKFPFFWFNSFIISLGSTIMALSLGVPAAYSIARFNYPWRRTFAYFIISLKTIPLMAIIVPYYIMFSRLNLLDTRTGLMIVYTTLNLSLVVWIMASFFKSLPPDLEDAARVDGCSWVGAFARVILPISLPGLSATTIFSLIVCWNEFLFALVLTTIEARPATVAVYAFQRFHEIVWGCLMGAGVLTALPVLIMVLVIQKYLVKGLLLGAMKG